MRVCVFGIWKYINIKDYMDIYGYIFVYISFFVCVSLCKWLFIKKIIVVICNFVYSEELIYV